MMATTRELVVRCDEQLKRIAADLDSEKGTRARANVALTEKIEKVETKVQDIHTKVAIIIAIAAFAQVALSMILALGWLDGLKRYDNTKRNGTSGNSAAIGNTGKGQNETSQSQSPEKIGAFGLGF